MKKSKHSRFPASKNKKVTLVKKNPTPPTDSTKAKDSMQESASVKPSTSRAADDVENQCPDQHDHENQIENKETKRPRRQEKFPIFIILIFPPPPAKGGITINSQDYATLGRDTYLNDIIIDFYLQYLYLRKMSEEQCEKTHIFGSFFYKRLRNDNNRMLRHQNRGSSSSLAEIRHSQVKSWTRKVDLFSKDFVIIPINESYHWSLAVICFPGLSGPVKMSDNTPIDLDANNEVENKPKTVTQDKAVRTNRNTSWHTSASIIVDKLNKSAMSTCEMEYDSGEFPGFLNSEWDSSKSNKYLTRQLNNEPIKQPCILIFDSLLRNNSNRAGIIKTLREYLQVEYKVKFGVDRDFSEKVVKAFVPKVPQQTNYVDCGLFVLEYVDQLFKQGIPDYNLPMTSLKCWFDPKIVSEKRRDIRNILADLMEEQLYVKKQFALPPLYLSKRDNDWGELSESELSDYSDDDCDVDSQTEEGAGEEIGDGNSQTEEEAGEEIGDGDKTDPERNSDSPVSYDDFTLQLSEDDDHSAGDEDEYNLTLTLVDDLANDEEEFDLTIDDDAALYTAKRRDEVDDFGKGNNKRVSDDKKDVPNRVCNYDSDDSDIFLGFPDQTQQEQQLRSTAMDLTEEDSSPPGVPKTGEGDADISQANESH